MIKALKRAKKDKRILNCVYCYSKELNGGGGGGGEEERKERKKKEARFENLYYVRRRN